ncbi:sugar transferase [Rhodosalinus sp. 5P4]|uniref:sugar transferase n=1 Tax=Rhodosalinus sp. 5P4 TaxID=3239196 RepID=UPI003525B979
MTIQLTTLYKDSSGAPVATGRDAAGFRLYRDSLKRFLDMALVLVSAPVVVPVIGALALLVALQGGRPFYSQLRVGRNGRIFRIWKLRTMVRDADARLEAHLVADADAREEWESMQKLKDDPRITPLGRILRKGSLDELPQLLNVLTGSMSLVGPRPMMVEQQALYSGSAYYGLRPGITGPWQISDRNACSFAGRVQYDESYDRDLSLWTDLRILAKTVVVVMRGTGC